MSLPQALVSVSDNAAKAVEYVAFVNCIQHISICVICCSAITVMFLGLIYIIASQPESK